MKISKARAAEHRAALLHAAERLFRERGYEGVNISEIAKAVGLTHGAFYTHFGSKEALFAEACESTLMRSAEAIRKGEYVASRDEFAARYLEGSHVADRATGCAMAALGDDAARGANDVRSAFARGLDKMFDAVASLELPDGERGSRRSAIAETAQLVGALVLARSVADTPLANEILAAVQETSVVR